MMETQKVLRLIRSIGKTAGQMVLYRMDHPSVEKSIEESWDLCRDLVREQGECSFSVDGEKLLLNGVVIGNLQQFPAPFTVLFRRMNLRSVVFLPHIQRQEWKLFYEFLSAKPESLRGGSAQEWLKTRGLKGVQVNFSVYAKVDREPPAAPAQIPPSPAPPSPSTEGPDLNKGPDPNKDVEMVSWEQALRELVQKAVQDPQEQSRFLEYVLDRCQKDLERRIREATETLEREKKTLKFEQERTSGVLSSLAEGVVVVDAQGQVMMMNDAAEKLYGGRLSEMAGKPLGEQDRRAQILAMARELGGPESGAGVREVELRGEEGVCRTLRASTATIKNQEGKVVGMVSVLSDLTKYRELERMQREFVASVTHELRNPLTSISTSLELLGESAGSWSPEHKRVLQIASKNVQRLMSLIRDILDFSKIQAGRMTAHPVPAAPELLLREAAEDFAYWAKSAHIALHLEPESGLPQVLADSGRIHQVFSNLISNALKFTPRGGRVSLRAGVNPSFPGCVVFSVEDTGRGIPAKDQQRIFDKFVQLLVGEKAAEGTGLGLSIAKALVHLHKGQMWVESAEGKGSVFRFTLPVASAVAGSARFLEGLPPQRSWWQKILRWERAKK